MRMVNMGLGIAVGVGLLFVGCGVVGIEETTKTTISVEEANKIFPTTLVVASPLKQGTTSSSKLKYQKNSISSKTAFEDISGGVEDILDGNQTSYDPTKLFKQARDASCYGPELKYVNHPDFTVKNSAFDKDINDTLPTGDLGIWTELEGSTTEPCISAQLNGRLEGSAENIQAAINTAAFMVKASNDANVMSDANGTVVTFAQIKDTLPTATNLTWTEANISESSGIWTYSFALTLSTTPTQSIVAVMQHSPSNLDYEGSINFTIVTGTEKDGGSLYYKKIDTAYELNTRRSTRANSIDFGLDSDVSSTYKVLLTQSAADVDQGYAIFASKFDFNTTVGDYVYAWTAGGNDDKSRILNVKIEENAGTRTAKGYYGYGDRINVTDGSILGMICYWAGPSNSHDPKDFYEEQSLEYNSSSESYFVTSSNILYAITNSCLHDGSGDFRIDRDLDGTVDATSETITTGTSDFLAQGITNIAIDLPPKF